MRYGYYSLFLLLAACKMPHPQVFALDQRVSVILPSQPKAMDAHQMKALKHPERVKVWALRTVGGVYQLTRAVNPARHITARDTAILRTYYERHLTGLRKLHARDIIATPFTVGGVEGMEFIYTRVRKPDKPPITCYLRCFARDSVGYSLVFVPANYMNLAPSFTDRQRDKFFSSLVVKP